MKVSRSIAGTFSLFFSLALILIISIAAPSHGFSGNPVLSDPELQRQLQGLPADQQETILKNLGNMGAPNRTEIHNGDTPAPAPQEENAKDDAERPRSHGPSKIEGQYRNAYSTSLSDNLVQFGYNVFENGSSRVSELAVPSSDYVLGPGDQLRIRVWGSAVDAQYTNTIAPDGTLDVPQIGVVPISGIRLQDARDIIRSEAEKYIQGINIDVSLSRLRSLEVYVVGAVENPGLHLVPAFSTVLRSLMKANGVKKYGSLRHIEVFRNNKLYKSVDLYKLLLEGAPFSDLVLENQDVIFVPRINKTVAVAGAVQEQGIYEIRNEKTIGDLISICGGIMPQAFTGRLYLRRFESNKEFVIQDIDTAKYTGDWRQIPVQNGDLLEFRYLTPENTTPRIVELKGHVYRPDVFDFKPGMMLTDILVSPDLIKPEAVMDFGLLHRYDPETTLYGTKTFPLSRVFSGQYNMPLEPMDRISILSRKDLGIQQEVEIRGAVWAPGTYTYAPGLTLEDLLSIAHGEKFGANLERIEISRQTISGETVETRHFEVNLKKTPKFQLEPYDFVKISDIKDARAFKKVVISGEVLYPGTYRIKDDERISDLIQRAGGFTDHAYFYGARYTSPDAQKIQQQSIDKMVNELETALAQQMGSEVQMAAASEEVLEAVQAQQMASSRILQQLKSVSAKGRIAIRLAPLSAFKKSKYDFKLQDGDELHIPMQPSFVTVIGSVYSPNSYLFENGLTISEYLEKAGGPTKTADAKYVYVLKANGEVISKEQDNGWFSSFDSKELMPGDTIVVPENLERVPYLRLTRDISDIIFKIATTAGIALAI